MSEAEETAYRAVIKKKYADDIYAIFDEAIKVNHETLRKKEDIRKQINKLLEIGRENSKILIYGAGKRGTALAEFLKDRGIDIEGYIISDDRDKNLFSGINERIYHFKEAVQNENQSYILVAAANSEIRDNLKKCNLNYYDIPNYVFPFIKEYVNLLC